VSVRQRFRDTALAIGGTLADGHHRRRCSDGRIFLGSTFRHINREGQIFDHAAEIASVEKLPFTMSPSEQIVDIASDTGVIHSVNTLIRGGKVLTRERLTDVFVLQDGAWKALSAQETTL
jgi:hypothetical protein